MADVENGDILRIGAVMQLETAFEIANVFHVRVEDGGGVGYASAAQDISEYMDEIYSNITTYIHNTQLEDYLSLANITQDTTFGAFAWGTFTGGSESQDKTAPGVALFTWARTLKPRVQIRKYWGVFSEVNMTGGLWLSAIRGACQNAMTDHVNNFEGSNGLDVKGVAYNRTAGTYTYGLAVSTSAEPAYQRRRRRGKGS